MSDKPTAEVWVVWVKIDERWHADAFCYGPDLDNYRQFHESKGREMRTDPLVSTLPEKEETK